ncbi:hypothetical protein EAI_02365 [Harpegnathos saltator]|uniref:Uncharacterized protein n=1 Tax=Harpegnathos saltator TaxID=610380 RepID=E2B6S6_HARSA|nr:hypothetical protein EAI_02365 [Harpegnathos saltator]
MGSQPRLWKREDYSERMKKISVTVFRTCSFPHSSRNKIARTDKDITCNINENGIDIIHDDAVHVTGNIIEYDDNGVDETTQDASKAGETQDFRISQATLVEGKKRVVDTNNQKNIEGTKAKIKECAKRQQNPTRSTIVKDANIIGYLDNAFREIHDYAINSGDANNYVGLTLASSDLTQEPAGLSLRPARDLTYNEIWNLLNSLAQSAGGHDILEHFEINIFNVAAASGRGKKSYKLTHEDIAKRSILTINNFDNLCFPRSLAAAIVYNERGNVRTGEIHDKWNSVRKQYSIL